MQPGQQQPDGEQPQGAPSNPPPPAPPGIPPAGPYPPPPGAAPQQPGFGQAPPPPSYGPGTQPYGQASPPGQPGNQRRTLIAVVAAVAAIALVIVGALVLGNDDDSPKDEQAASERELFGGSDGDHRAPGNDDEGKGVEPGQSGTGGNTGGSSDTGSSGSTGGTEAPAGPLVKPSNTTGPDGTTVLIGVPDATDTLELYEDPRCPPCAMFEQSVGETVIKDIQAGKYKASFHLATFLDTSLGGSGSRNAVSALGAALNVSTHAFLEYKKALYTEENHPTEGADSFSDDTYLLKVAEQVPALAGNSAFAQQVRSGVYDAWAQKMSAAFNASGVEGTPTVKLNGTKLTGSTGSTPMTAADFTAAVDDRI
ncbi:thioredoxin domain-containing protein [Streptomyces sp. HSW2009]|uniref:thioredoxin domain-containing protein n=1 Tax=Streptomyces sp. HSW2009 TaxID=3142890 RepID=UPI0032EAF2DF